MGVGDSLAAANAGAVAAIRDAGQGEFDRGDLVLAKRAKTDAEQR
jgi:hypothetical protein